MSILKGKIALVTGASEGIGAAICRELVKQGMTVLGCARNKDLIEAIGSEEEVRNSSGKLIAMGCDLTKDDQLSEMYKKIEAEYKEIDVCINNAVILKNSSLLDGKTAEWREMIEVGVLAVCANTREAIKIMNKETGIVIQMGGIVGHKIPAFPVPPKDTPTTFFQFYNGMKFMIRALTEGLREELKTMRSKIRVSTISPGSVQTGLLGRATGKEAEADRYFAAYRCLQPKDVADAVIYMLSRPEYMTIHDIIMEPVAFQI